MDEEPYYRPQSYLWHIGGSSVSFCDWCDFLEEPQAHAQVWSPSLFPTSPKSSSWRYPWYPHFPCLLASCSWLMAVTRRPSLMCGRAVPWWKRAHAVVPSAPTGSSYLRITPDPAAPPGQYFLPQLAQTAGHYATTSLNHLPQVSLAGAGAFDDLINPK